jgi:predicted Fe-Mo cluster-binding NifX family protein
MIIAIPTSDRNTVFTKTGKAKEFALFKVIDGSFESMGFRENPYKHEDSKNHERLLLQVVDTLNDCSALLVKGAGYSLVKEFQELNIPIYKTNETQVKEAISAFAFDILHHEHI